MLAPKYFFFLFALAVLWLARGEAFGKETSPTERLVQYFESETRKIERACLAKFDSVDEWESQRARRRSELLEMLGLDPLPKKTPLEAVVTGMAEADDFVVERLHFQSRPGLYVTANLYRPKIPNGRLPAILYGCGHGAVRKDGISYGNKVHYQHHGAWFARNGLCLFDY